ncbi:transcriptional regulator [Candidatus Falkowbacteria bacterium CG10_big_fil_rev_8_21_14_0_10_37_14]|uniref:Transcriptional regulator n=1 Tax=Candidatus Falkowbacteria bacterium CG10_big_fil_rev_8_21_14_0_10_37_14 TaxID=1974561 RepID=A0A2M6WTK0_9BACT|nr:MAG: transcriptional regulator [Candidatus Falkowbacteria bacterium CG10_big_fil_rev_8_21_14_0_10_37_14]
MLVYQYILIYYMINKVCVNRKVSLEFGDLSKFFKVVGEENRLRILCLLKTGECCVCEIFENLDLSQNLISSHLRVLRESKLIKFREEKQKHYYSINKKVFKKYNRLLAKFLKSYE